MNRIAIVEDEAEARTALRENLVRYAKVHGREIQTEEFSGTIDFLEKYKGNFDLILIDIHMPNMSGMEMAQKLRKIDKQVLIIFETSMQQYALQGYAVNAFDFILKPVSYERLSACLDRVFSLLDNRKSSRVVIKAAGAITCVEVSEILYIEIIHHRIIYHTPHGEYSCYGSLLDVERRLPPDEFARANMSYLVNLRHVKKIRNGEVIIGDVSIRMTRTCKKPFMEALAKYLGFMGEE